MRAQVNIYWIDEQGNQLWEMPEEGTDYTITGKLPAEAGWAQGTDGLYYWTTPLESNGTTGKLIDRIEQTEKQLANYNDGRKLVVDIAVQSIQHEPAEALKEAWGVTVKTGADGNVSLETNGDGNVVVNRTASTGGSIETTTEGEE